jgi:hypothetical protein
MIVNSFSKRNCPLGLRKCVKELKIAQGRFYLEII